MYCKIIEMTHSTGFFEYRHNKIGPANWPQLLAGDGYNLVVARGQELAIVDTDGICRWPTPVTCPGPPNNAYISGDRLLVTTSSIEYTAWGNLGPALMFNITNGSLIAQLTGEHGAPLNNGHFVLGLEGYDFFDTWLYGPNGDKMNTWRSYGHYIIDPDDSIRVIECDRCIPTKSRVVRLLPDGSIKRGPHLKGCQVSAPVILANGKIIFVDNGLLRTVDRNLHDEFLVELISIPTEEEWRFSDILSLNGVFLTVVIRERSEEIPAEYTTHRWVLELKDQ